MIGILLLSHGRMCEGMLDSCKLFFGDDVEKIKAISLLATDDVEQYDERVIAALNEIDDGSGVIALCDLYGGSPANRCINLLSQGHKMRVITGMNLSMLIELLGLRLGFEHADEIDLEALMQAGKDTILCLNDEVAKAAGDDEEDFF